MTETIVVRSPEIDPSKTTDLAHDETKEKQKGQFRGQR